jgi:hypothetical protein
MRHCTILLKKNHTSWVVSLVNQLCFDSGWILRMDENRRQQTVNCFYLQYVVSRVKIWRIWWLWETRNFHNNFCFTFYPIITLKIANFFSKICQKFDNFCFFI